VGVTVRETEMLSVELNVTETDVDWEADRVIMADEDGRLLIVGEPAEVADGLDDSNEDTDAEVDTVLVDEGKGEIETDTSKCDTTPTLSIQMV
jgi:alkanesulfonate monooxygenase SsuD/methylene tetrahydromethanopterin reductase-like flavin-dependent oxidoreductase (luciferase family)